jgi:hypothetical protein
MDTMPFGKFRGWPLPDLPDDYLRWLRTLPTLREPLRSAIAEEWARRGEGRSGVGSLAAEVRPLVEEVVAVGYRQLAKVHHPDHGGAKRTMQRLNDAVDWLRRVVGSA